MVDANLIFWPMIVQAFVTLVLYVVMSRARIASIKQGRAKASDFRLPNRDEGDETRAIANAVTNQFELPVLFFAVCLAAHAAGTVNALLIALAWCFVITKTAHSYVHATSNKLRHRRPIFIAAFFTVTLMWVWFGVGLLSVA